MTASSETSPNEDLLGEGRDLVHPDARIGVPIPAYHGRSLGNLAASLWAQLGPPGRGEGPPLPPLARDLDPFQRGRPEGPVVVLLLDGLGWSGFRDSARRKPAGTASRWIGRARPITSVFPTSTTVALTSLSTGSAPGQHGVVGHRGYLPRFGTVVELLRMSPLGVAAPEALVGPEWSPSLVSGVPSIFRRGIPTVALSRDRFEGTGFTRLIYDGATFVPYSTGSDLAFSLVEVLGRSDPPPLTFAYRDDLDVGQHSRGPRPELVDLELERVDSLLSFVGAHLQPARVRRTCLLVTGDHGQVPMDADRQLIVDRAPDLLEHLSRPPAGDRRATYFAARPGHLPDLRAALLAHLPPGGHLLELPRAVDVGLFGPPPWHSELAERLGDLLFLSPSPGGVSYSVPGASARPHRMKGAHGGLEAEELLVPLVAGTLEELLAGSSPPGHLIPTPPPSRDA